MNLLDSSFLCLDLGSSAVRGLACRVQNGLITKSAAFSAQSYDTVFAIKSVIDELEKQIGRSLDRAFITGNFGNYDFNIITRTSNWPKEHKITQGDILEQTTREPATDGFAPLHIIPLRFDTAGARNLANPAGQISTELTSVFGAISCDSAQMQNAAAILRAAHLQSEGFYDGAYLLSQMTETPAAFLDLGAEFSSLSVWTKRGPVFFKKINIGQDAITNAIADEFDISRAEALRIKHSAVRTTISEMDRFTPADANYDFSRADLNSVALEILNEIGNMAKEELAPFLEKYEIDKLYLSGGGSELAGSADFFKTKLNANIEILGAGAAVFALKEFVWNAESYRVKSYLARRARWKSRISALANIFARKKKKRRPHLVPIMPSVASFDMNDPATYIMFANAGIGALHIDIMDGFFVDKITGGIEELRAIRARTRMRLNVHLMTESPVSWATAAAEAGADTIIVSTGTAGARAALRKIKELGKRAGIALNPESPAAILKPVLREIDEVLVMSVRPGASGQKFMEEVLPKISALANTRKKYGLKYRISVDGGINAETARMCWAAGADMLASETYLAHAPDFALAVESLLPK
ncbi:MAG: ribulose-phosphate 3-epimerase [Rickettsiales bacterium]|jgi:ribulose-phosphate 3-epimerase|nr:ribulose-phosphate 3-epimerase [Rickettsiales bacterium]